MKADDSEAIIVIDDFLKRPHEMRDRGLAAVYPEVHDAPYPGRNSTELFELRGLNKLVSEITRQTLVPAPNMAHGAFRLSLAGEVGSGGVHIDPCHWTCILYLSAPEDCRGGTDFFRHRATRTIRAPVFPGEREELPVTWESVCRDMDRANAKDSSRWEHVRNVPMRFNRFLIFRPWLYHDAGPGFGTHAENGRLIYVAFYNCIDPGWT